MENSQETYYKADPANIQGLARHTKLPREIWIVTERASYQGTRVPVYIRFEVYFPWFPPLSLE